MAVFLLAGTVFCRIKRTVFAQITRTVLNKNEK